MQHVRIPCRHRWNPMPTRWCANLLLLLFQCMKSNSQKIPPRILYPACPGQELHKCLDWQCLATTVWSIVKHARMSLARLFLCMFIVFLCMDGCNYLVQAAAVLWDYLPSLCMSGEAIASKHYPSLALRMPACLHLDNLIQLAVFHQFAALGSLDRARIPHFFRAPRPNLRDAQANKGKTLFLRRVSSLIFVHVERGLA